MKNASPLRYPGGKWRLAQFFERLIRLNFRRPPVYIEPYAGGASLALSLLFAGKVGEVFLNDLDPAIHAFWDSALNRAGALVDLIDRAKLTPNEWRKQREIYRSGPPAGSLALGFAAFFLNRTNHSGILNGGMIGGKKQTGRWRLDARFNRHDLMSRVLRVAAYRDRIHLSGVDAKDFIIRRRWRNAESLAYLDPPYFRAGHRLYLNSYRPQDHARLRTSVLTLRCRWVVSYDDAPEIRKLYRSQRSRTVELLHTARTARKGREVLFFSAGLSIPAIRNRGLDPRSRGG